MRSLRSLSLHFIALISCLGMMGAPLYGQDPSDTWPQFRGPNRDSRYHRPAWPDSIGSEHLKPTWRMELGPGYGGPIVSRDKVFVNEPVS